MRGRSNKRLAGREGEGFVKWLVTGARGMLGRELCPLLAARGEDVTGLSSTQCDVRDLTSVRRALDGQDVVVNAAAWTAVDEAESKEADAFAVNAIGARNVALAARDVGARTVQISTDYVFDGAATTPYPHDHPQSPRSAYGRTKCAGEWAVLAVDPNALVIRTAWLYGSYGSNFVSRLRSTGVRGPVSVVDDQFGQPTWARDLADFIHRSVSSGAPGGVHHGVNASQASRFEFARAIFETVGLDPELVHPCRSTDFSLPAERPAYSVLAHRPDTVRMRDWREALTAHLAGSD
jgi:dTDP-4-dehydrorhamnose reductase